MRLSSTRGVAEHATPEPGSNHLPGREGEVLTGGGLPRPSLLSKSNPGGPESGILQNITE
jgi:hypothetical protein